MYQNQVNNDYNTYYNNQNYYTQYLDVTDKFNRPNLLNMASAKTNLTYAPSITATNDIHTFLHNAGDPGREYIN